LGATVSTTALPPLYAIGNLALKIADLTVENTEPPVFQSDEIVPNVVDA
jgi:hypothetical protein